LNWVASTAYPLWESITYLHRNEESKGATTQWLAYWIIRTVLYGFEAYVLHFVIEYFPLYWEIRLLAFLWLVTPNFQGAAYLWELAGKIYFDLADKHLLDIVAQMTKSLNQAIGKATPGTGGKADDKRRENFEKSQKTDGTSPRKKD